MKVREGSRVVLVHVQIATGVNADGHREILGVDLTSAEDGAGWLAFFGDLTARGLSVVSLVTSDAHTGLGRHLGLHRLPQGAVAADLVQQPRRTSQPQHLSKPRRTPT
jgi:transposase-like protein